MAPAVGPANDLDMITMIQSLQNQILEMRESGAGAYGPHDRVETSYSPFTAQVLTRPFGKNIKLPTIPPYDGRSDPNFHIQHCETWMLM